jgi:D-glycero-D-manno-heptose 1,7-bisphosphate phosphatase
VTSITGVPAAFLDRDGVINVDSGYVYRVANFQFIPGVLGACRSLHMAGYKLIVVTNQAGIAHGYYDEQAFKEITGWMSERFREAGAPLTGVYYCPHHPCGRVARFTRECSCRKPAPGMIAQAVREHQIDVANSFLVGDKESDLEAAERAGISTRYLVRTAGRAAEQSDRSGEFESLADVVHRVLGRVLPDSAVHSKMPGDRIDE